ncbi:MAG: acetate--CoA ligase family protein, partial [Trebonia sp.]
GALTSPLELGDAACRGAGALRAQTPAELVHVVAYLLTAQPPTGPRVAVVSDSGGQGALAADCLSLRGLAVPELTAVAAVLARRLPSVAATANPVDLAGAGERDLGSYRDVAAALLASGEVDSVLLSGYFGRYGQDSPALAALEKDVAEQLGGLVRETGRPLVVHSMGTGSRTASALRDTGIPVYDTIEAAADALSGAVALGTRPGRPSTAVTPADTADLATPVGSPADVPAGRRAAATPADPPPETGYWAARTLLRDAGIAFTPARRVSDQREATEAAARLTAPYVLKAAWLEHKSESGGVTVGLTDAAAVAHALAEMRRRLGNGPYVLEEQDVRRDVVEMIVGARRDTGMGPMIMVGVGGTEAELYRDVVTECAPVDLGQALAMVNGLRCAPLLAGWRGRPAADVESLARAVVAVSELVTRLPGDTIEVEVNPIRVGTDGAIAVDALLVPADGRRGHANGNRRHAHAGNQSHVTGEPAHTSTRAGP